MGDAGKEVGVLKQEAEIVSFHVGIGDWRLENNGTNGMFRVVRDGSDA